MRGVAVNGFSINGDLDCLEPRSIHLLFVALFSIFLNLFVLCRWRRLEYGCLRESGSTISFLARVPNPEHQKYWSVLFPPLSSSSTLSIDDDN